MMTTARYTAIAFLLALATGSCSVSQSTLCDNGIRCPRGWTCAAAQDICIRDSCGNGAIDGDAEQCDDGNVLPGDGCSEVCESEVYPYLQWATPTSVRIHWATHYEGETWLEWGPSQEFGSTAMDAQPLHIVEQEENEADDAVYLHRVELTGLSPATEYHYQVMSDDFTVAPHTFTTPPEPGTAAAERPFCVVVMGDPSAIPNEYAQVVSDGVVRGIAGEFALEPGIACDLAFVLMPGNLARPGAEIRDWQGQFFRGSNPLMTSAPLYPVPGANEDADSNFYDYFHFDRSPDPQNPDDACREAVEPAWCFDYSNVRVIGLDSSDGFNRREQLDWLSLVLEQTATADHIDFVIAQVYSTYLGQGLPGPGPSFTRSMITDLETFSEDSGKPSLHVTAGRAEYFRGQSVDAPHLWLGTSLAGQTGASPPAFLDMDPNIFSVSQGERGFVLLTSNPAERSLEVRRIGLGGEGEPGEPPAADMEGTRDLVELRRDNDQPDTPDTLGPNPMTPIMSECGRLIAEPFFDPDQDGQATSHWQVARDCIDFAAPVPDTIHDVLFFEPDWYTSQGFPTAVQSDSADLPVLLLQEGGDFCWRVRYRDRSLAWSEWSDPQPFSALPLGAEDNLLQNPAGDGPPGAWELVAGEFDLAAEGGVCSAPAPLSNPGMIALGEVPDIDEGTGQPICRRVGYSEIYQRVSVPPNMMPVTTPGGMPMGGGTVAFSGYLYASGHGVPQMELIFYDGEGAELARAAALGTRQAGWTLLADDHGLPAGTAEMEFVLTSNEDDLGDASGSYFDDLVLLVIDRAQLCPMPGMP